MLEKVYQLSQLTLLLNSFFPRGSMNATVAILRFRLDDNRILKASALQCPAFDGCEMPGSGHYVFVVSECLQYHRMRCFVCGNRHCVRNLLCIRLHQNTRPCRINVADFPDDVIH